MGVRHFLFRVTRRVIRPATEFHFQARVRAIRASQLFDETFYLSTYADVVTYSPGPLDHYLRYGYKEGRDPAPNVSTAGYFDEYPEAAQSGLDPLSHYLQIGKAKGYSLNPINSTTPDSADDRARPYIEEYKHWARVARSTAAKPEPSFVPHHSTSVKGIKPLVKAIAFYLPQFHPIPENDEWWGKGFTEWTNVSKAAPVFHGHYQPHLPGELGFYDLRLAEVQERQVELAREYGIYGFAFYHYWFAGKRLLEKPLESFTKNPRIKFPFCLIWANENWTRRWDGLEQDILLQQVHTAETDIRYIESIQPYLEHPEYIRVDGRPLLMIYRSDLLPDPRATVDRWREYCIKHGLGNPLLVAAQTFGLSDTTQYGFDAAVQFPPHNETLRDAKPRFGASKFVTFVAEEYKGRVFSYPALVSKKLAQTDTPAFPTFETVVPMWDNCARKPNAGDTLAFASPELYELWLTSALQRTLADQTNPGKLLFINAWNEWAEGAHLEPDRRYGYGFLDATRRALTESRDLLQPDNVDVTLSTGAVLLDPGYVGSQVLAHGLEQVFGNACHVHAIESETRDAGLRLDEMGERRVAHFGKTMLLLVTVIRDPIARSIEAFAHNAQVLLANFEQRLEAHDISAEELQQLYFEFMGHSALDDWLTEQYVGSLRLDVFQVPFNHRQGYGIYHSGKVKALVIRQEDLTRAINSALSELSGRTVQMPISTLPEDRTFNRVIQLLTSKPLPELYIREVYGTKYARHFYTESEIAAFRKKWMHG